MWEAGVWNTDWRGTARMGMTTLVVCFRIAQFGRNFMRSGRKLRELLQLCSGAKRLGLRQPSAALASNGRSAAEISCRQENPERSESGRGLPQSKTLREIW